MEYIIGFVIIAAVVGSAIGLTKGGLKGAGEGALHGGGMAAGCIMQLVFSALPVIAGLVIIGLIAQLFTLMTEDRRWTALLGAIAGTDG